MSAAQIYLLKTVMKAFGIDPEKVSSKAAELQSIVLEYDLNEIRSAMKTILDYERNQAQNEMRLLAILNHLGIADPVLIAQLQLGYNPTSENDQ